MRDGVVLPSTLEVGEAICLVGVGGPLDLLVLRRFGLVLLLLDAAAAVRLLLLSLPEVLLSFCRNKLVNPPVNPEVFGGT